MGTGEAVHRPVLVAETLAALNLPPNARVVDATLGLGGHAAALMEAGGPARRLWGIDRDPQALARARERLAPWGDRITYLSGNYSELNTLLQEPPGSFDGVLADLGVSSMQLDTPERGFAFSNEGPLDMRMGSSKETAADYLKRVDVETLEAVLRAAGEERFAAKVARRLKENAETFRTTSDLAAAVSRWIPRRGKSHPATRVFLALRMAVNRELEHLSDFLNRVPNVLRPGGRLVVITFHSTEDRLVKRHWKDHWNPGVLRAVSKKVIIAGAPEQRDNPRSRSAKLRVFEKTEVA